MEDLRSIVEALIFASEAPLSVDKIAEIVGVEDRAAVIAVIKTLDEEYAGRNGGFHLAEVAGGYQFRTRADMASWLRKLKGIRPPGLSQAALETLAVVAYRQPVTRHEIEKVRGVDVSGALRGLLDKRLLRMLGRKNVPGKPIIYGTTKRFLEVFNLKDLSELPTLREFQELQE
ncbi:MAG TPA: SMC-Scp complex subunit ScpB [Syntrophales bacterium]|nr:SMC-Scp complex subunit ScpB [Syntrophales bacterium]HOX94685.1 SMC-Scp complex subunit ScpB [Syntrophales bacterium]HPI55776.1 SMC-Scp complex subunit ScpB [Syntrophales bacterium]HPN23732.1 SMC-Scp complex subunit ScpB [Syntrophales bacterium]HQM27742.1 SMC-Scp complex subunit ScpB [Syntrophales bacterium]